MATLKFIKQDIFEVYPNEDSALMCHVVNDQNAMGSGFVVPLMKMYPEVKSEYHAWFCFKLKSYVTSDPKLGENQYVKTHDNSYVVNMMAQTLGGNRPLYYNALAKCMDDVANKAIGSGNKIIGPLFSVGLAGGNINVLKLLIVDCWLRKGLDVEIYYLPELLPKNITEDMLQDVTV